VVNGQPMKLVARNFETVEAALDAMIGRMKVKVEEMHRDGDLTDEKRDEALKKLLTPRIRRR
jgi:hypothetical protein